MSAKDAAPSGKPNDAGRVKVSRYLTRVPLDEVDTLLLYGGLGGRLLEVTGARRDDAEALLADPNSEAVDPLTRKLFKDHGILVPEEWNEFALTRQRSTVAHDPNTGALSLTICPTVNCNYRCTYCFQHHVGKIMSKRIQDRLLQFVRQQTPPVSFLNITWFGGEPLLGRSVIERLSAKLVDMVGEDSYSAHIISNGWLLTPEVTTWLVGLGVTGVQVTLDGPREVHDLRRPLAGGLPTFDRILENIAGADPGLSISVRVNTDLTNAEHVTEVFDQLDEWGLRGRVSVYFAPVTAYTEVCADTAGDCIAGQDWSRLNSELRLRALERGYGGPGLPRARTGVCIADNPRGWVVAPDGLVYKCWNDVTQPENAVMNIGTGHQTKQMTAELNKWKAWSPFELPECIDCKVLPQCHSGCAHIAMRQPGEITHGDCTELKWNLPETLAIYYLGRMRHEAAEQLKDRLPEHPPRDMDPGPQRRGRLSQIKV